MLKYKLIAQTLLNRASTAADLAVETLTEFFKDQTNVRLVSVGIGSIIAICIVCKLAHRKPAITRATASSSGISTRSAAIAIRASNRPTALTVRQPNKVATRNAIAMKHLISRNIHAYLNQIIHELGKDSYGNLSMVLILRQLSPQTVNQSPILKNLCVSQATCPLPLNQVFQVGLQRLDKANDIVAKELLQKQLIESPLDRNSKVAILTSNLADSQVLNLPESSQVHGQNNILLASSSQYLLFTGHELLQLHVQPLPYLQAMTNALDHSQDRVGRQLVAKALMKAYPSYASRVSNELAKNRNLNQ